MTIEEIIEDERTKLSSEGLTPVTLETFKEWKKRKEEKRQKELEAKMLEESKKQSGKASHIMSGRALFKYDPTLFMDDADAVDEQEYQEREEIEEVEESKEQDPL